MQQFPLIRHNWDSISSLILFRLLETLWTWTREEVIEHLVQMMKMSRRLSIFHPVLLEWFQISRSSRRSLEISSQVRRTSSWINWSQRSEITLKLPSIGRPHQARLIPEPEILLTSSTEFFKKDSKTSQNWRERKLSKSNRPPKPRPRRSRKQQRKLLRRKQTQPRRRRSRLKPRRSAPLSKPKLPLRSKRSRRPLPLQLQLVAMFLQNSLV